MSPLSLCLFVRRIKSPDRSWNHPRSARKKEYFVKRNYLYNKGVRPNKKKPKQQVISYLERERERVGKQAGICKVRLGWREIEGRDRDTER